MAGRKPAWIPPWIWLAQETHFLLGALFVFGGQAVARSALAGAVVILALGTAKEFTWDIRVEGATPRQGLHDLLFYAVGAGAALLITAAFHG